MDRAFVRESDEGVTLKLHHKGTPIAEFVIFVGIFVYLYVFYSTVRYLYG